MGPKIRRNRLIAIDLGNSSATFGVFEGRKLLRHGYTGSASIPHILRRIRIGGINSHSYQVIISSVVPLLSNKLRIRLCRDERVDKVYEVGRNLSVRVPMAYRASELGADRLVNVYGARILYPLPCLVLDFGTAITADLISREGVFKGGLIIPGVEISFRALTAKAALLPKLRGPIRVRQLVGHDSKGAMSSGLLNGYGALANGLVERFRDEYGKRLTVVATGGYAARIAAYARCINYLDPLHTIKSLALVYEREVKK